LVIVVSVLLIFTASGYLFDIFKLLLGTENVSDIYQSICKTCLIPQNSVNNYFTLNIQSILLDRVHLF